MGKKGGKKAKGPTYYVTDEHVMPFGFRANDIIKTPLGLTGTVIGVKYEQPEQKVGGKLWVGTMPTRAATLLRGIRRCPSSRGRAEEPRSNAASHSVAVFLADALPLHASPPLHDFHRNRVALLPTL